ncbi:MAG: membrane metalloprotease [Bacteroidia bacterium]|nr:membrane metalloprotease [Bacteroidia bacterium]
MLACSKDAESNDQIIIEDPNGDPVTIDTSVNKKNVGDSANDLLSGQTFTELVLEIMYLDGYKPTEASISNLIAFLEARLNKSAGLRVVEKEITITQQTEYSIQDIIQIEDENRAEYNFENTIAVSGIFIDGGYDQNTNEGSVLGVAYRNTSFVIFEETVQSFANQPFAPSLTTLETTVMNHEMGHLLGLVNAGTSMQSDHQDVAHGRHCTTDNCLMYWTAETGEGLLDMLIGGTVPSLDTLCLDDLQANGGK